MRFAIHYGTFLWFSLWVFTSLIPFHKCIPFRNEISSAHNVSFRFCSLRLLLFHRRPSAVLLRNIRIERLFIDTMVNWTEIENYGISSFFPSFAVSRAWFFTSVGYARVWETAFNLYCIRPILYGEAMSLPSSSLFQQTLQTAGSAHLNTQSFQLNMCIVQRPNRFLRTEPALKSPATKRVD